MRFFAVHDEQGRIASIVAVVGDSGRQFSLTPEPGQMVSEVDIPRLPGKLEDEKGQRALLDVIQNYRVEAAHGTRKLVRKTKRK